MNIARLLPFAFLVLAMPGPGDAAAPAKPAPAAAAPQTVDTVRQAARENKRALVEKNMDLTAEEAKKFWPIWDAYQKQLDGIVQKQNRVVLDYVNSESSMTDANAKRMVTDVLALDAEEAKLRAATVKKVMAALPAKKGARFFQVENKIRTLNRYDVAEKVRLVQ